MRERRGRGENADGGRIHSQDKHGKLPVESRARPLCGGEFTHALKTIPPTGILAVHSPECVCLPAVALQDVGGLVECSAERRGRNRREQNQPRALHGDGGRGGARRPGQADL